METVGRCNTDCVGLVPTFFSADVRSNDGHSIDGRQVSDERVKKPEDSITLRYVNQKSSSQAEEEEDGEDCQEIAASFSPSTVHHCPVHSHYHLNRHGSDQSSTTGTVTGTNHSSFRDSDVDQDKNDWERWRDDSQQLPKRPQRGTEAENNKSEAKTSTIRQHYYPEGGWGWLVCACAFVVHLLTTGLQLSYGTFYLEVLDKFGSENVVVTGKKEYVCLYIVSRCRAHTRSLRGISLMSLNDVISYLVHSKLNWVNTSRVTNSLVYLWEVGGLPTSAINQASMHAFSVFYVLTC